MLNRVRTDYARFIAHIQRHALESMEARPAFSYPTTPRAAVEFVKRAKTAWVWEEDGHVRAHAIVTPSIASHRGTFSAGVEGPMRGRGIGRAVMSACIDDHREQSTLRWLDGAAFDDNHRVLHLDYSLGFRSVGVIPDCHHGAGQHILVLDLRSATTDTEVAR